MNYSWVISLENYSSSFSYLPIASCMHGSCICIHDMLPAASHRACFHTACHHWAYILGSAGDTVCLLISAVVSDIWVKRLFKHRWLQNLYVAMAPSWHSLGGLEVFRCQRCNLLKWFTCHFWDICFLWKDRELEGWAVRSRRLYFSVEVLWRSFNWICVL